MNETVYLCAFCNTVLQYNESRKRFLCNHCKHSWPKSFVVNSIVFHKETIKKDPEPNPEEYFREINKDIDVSPRMLELTCSNCKGKLKWNQNESFFVCENCGTRFKLDNDFTYRYVNQARIEEARIELEKKKLDIEEQHRNDTLSYNIIIDLLLGFLLFEYFCFKASYVVVAITLVIWLLLRTRGFGKFKK